MTTVTHWPGGDVVRPALDRATAMRLAETEYGRVTDAVDALREHEWVLPTDCPDWDVHRLVAHVVGQALLFSSPWSWCARCGRPARGSERGWQPSTP